MLIFIRIIPN